MRLKPSKIIALLSLISALAGCQNPAVIKSNKINNVDFQPKNTLTVLHIPKGYLDDLNSFETAFSTSLRNCGVNISYLYLPAMERSLSLTDDSNIEKNQIRDAIKKYSADSILDISVQSTTSPGATFNGDYKLAFYKTQNTQTTWTGHASVFNAGSANFASTLASNLQRDGILNNCQSINK